MRGLIELIIQRNTVISQFGAAETRHEQDDGLIAQICYRRVKSQLAAPCTQMAQPSRECRAPRRTAGESKTKPGASLLLRRLHNTFVGAHTAFLWL
jgi:hypothetical protein